MRETFLPFSPPLIGDAEIEEVVDTLRSDWITTGPKVEAFQARFAELVGASAALALNSGTAALEVALATLGVGPGDAVLTTPMTFCSTVHVIERLGARPVLVDVDPDTLNISPAFLERALTEHKQPRVVLPVHLYGHPAEMDSIFDLADQYRLAVVEDAAHSLPARYRGRMIGKPLRDNNLIAFSFYATKNLTTGEGGMLTGSPDLLDEAKVWSLHGMSRDAFKRYTAEGSWRYDVVRPGFKYNMPDLQAAIGLHQVDRLESMHRRRKEIVSRYRAGLECVEALELPVERADVDHAWHIFAIRLRLNQLGISRDRFIEELRARNVGTSVHFIPVHEFTYYRERYGYRPLDYPVAHAEFERLISLPLNVRMSDRDVDDVVAAVSDVAAQNRR